MTDDLMNFEIPSHRSSIIKVIGVGGGGSNAVNYMYNLGIKDVNFVVCNTDAQALVNSPVPIKVQLGESLTEGRGAGNKPDRGRQAAIESIGDLTRVLGDNTKMVFITAGMGGGTGTGAAPVVAQTAKDMGILTVGIVTIPFKFEGKVRISQAIDGIAEMEKHVDSLLIINNEKLREMYGDLKLSNAFSRADNVLATAAKGIAEIITVHGYINVDFADVETVMKDSGVAIMGSGTGIGEFRAIDAIQAALESPLLNNNKIEGAGNILLNITSGKDEITMDEVGQITDYVQDVVGHSASIIWGTGNEESLDDEVTVTIIATGFAYSNMVEPTPAVPEKKVTRLEMDSEGNLSPVGDESPSFVDCEDEIEMDDLPPRVVQFSDVDKEREKKIELLYGKSEKEKRKTSDEDDIFAVDDDVEPLLIDKRSNDSSVSVDPEDLLDEKRIDEIENVPAYKRRNVRPQNQSSSVSVKDEPRVSRFSITDNGGKPKISPNNRYLHDNVD
ncbi:cell division protein FtsZ [Natronoflexus pectinivorans]|uniref:Cell division protein FtsZ n=1 Tax=Natronoflexus pectinivorans TaxID=682526 RepID=A0A4R2GCE6_9BACT|nr:cell division protein FtsZ [Natronoflexus pectinivorans]TCO04949.1 cell division protein FtsZ [Natronoflexus pectinivorans]